MRKLLLATTILSTIAIQAYAASTVITPGQGSLVDSAGNEWVVTASGSIKENDQWVAGGGGTAALTIVNGSISGEDAHGKGWFTLSGNSNYWTASSAPSSTATVATAATAATPVTTKGTTAPASTATPSQPCGVIAGGAASGKFTASSTGQIDNPDGSVFIARGINIMAGTRPSVSAIQVAFPGVNLVRIAIADYASAASLQAYVNSFTAAGIVVSIGDYYNGSQWNNGGSQGTIFTGQQLQSELAWYTSVAGSFKDNPYVWFSTNNEPSETNASGQMDPSALSSWQQATYQAIRNAGNNSPVFMEANSWGPGQTNVGYTASAYAGMKNVGWDVHQYGWLSKYSTDQATVTATLTSILSDLHAIGSADGTMPILIGEYGNSTTGMSIDANGSQVLTAVQSSGYGSAAWAWGPGNPGDGLTDGGNGLSAYGQEVAGYFALTKGAAASIWACSSLEASNAAQQTVAQANVTVANAATPDSGTADTTALAIPDAATASMQAAQQSMAATDAQVSATDASHAATLSNSGNAATAAQIEQATALAAQVRAALAARGQ